jgi:hypothetical protein
MNSEKLKTLFTGIRPVEYDVATVRELLNAKWVSLFSAKLYVSNIRAIGCLRVEDEVEVT